MKKALKRILFYDKIYPHLKSSFIYQFYKKTLARRANMINGNPSKDFFVIGVTGTNGKTTTVNMLHKMLNDLLAPTVMISTSDIRIGDKHIANEKKMSSLDVGELQSILATAKRQNCKVAVLEVTSHGLDQYRFHGIKFDYAILTNITKDHLDYHGDMNNYIHTKKQLFKYVLQNGKENKFGSFPADDRVGKKRNDELALDKKITYSITASAILKANNIQEKIDGTEFNITYLGQDYPAYSQMLGEYNVYNFLAALSVGLNTGLDIQQCIKSLEEFSGISGRTEHISHNGVQYFVDFAHSPDALDKVLRFMSKIKGDGRIITVLGAAGNRDRSKRPEMGNIAWRYSNVLIATDDDPDTENRFQIIQELTSKIQKTDIPKGQEIFIIPERKFAIKLATEIAKPGDIVLLAGKGHETIQLTNLGKRKRNDRKVLEHYLKNN